MEDTDTLEWESTKANNVILDFEDFFISFNPCPMPGTTLGSDHGGAETALVRREDGAPKYYILNGDYREEYEDALRDDPSFEAAWGVFESNREAESSWSNA